MNKYENDNTIVKIPVDDISLEGLLSIPESATGLVIFVHGTGSGRFSPRNTFVAKALQQAGFATLLFDLLTEEEDTFYSNRFDIDLLTERLMAVTKWAAENYSTSKMKIGYFGASTGAAAAIKAAVELDGKISAIVSRGGRVDLAAADISELVTPTLLIVGENDSEVLELNELVFDHIGVEKKLEVVSGATHLFEEEGALAEVARLAREWFKKYLP